MWCNPCRAVGMIHCAHPDECGNMLSDKAAADNWKAWLDDLPLDAGFAEGIGQVQDFISGTVARAEAAEAEAATLRARLARMEGALVEHNDLLRSALSIAKREGVDGEIASTNWDAYYNRVAVVLKRHHQTANEARAAHFNGGAE